MKTDQRIKLVWYGDDFTGSTDALEFLTRAGVRSVLFFQVPESHMIARFGFPDAIGIAGMTRAMTPPQITETLEPVFAKIWDLNPEYVHYKVCSTFDSSPETGNIGTAIETAERVFGHHCTPVIVAAPHLGRYMAFGHLFARMGIGSAGRIYRIDRHPSMSRHPVTPAKESDLSIHLSAQLAGKSGSIDLNDLEHDADFVFQKYKSLKQEGCRTIFVDGMNEAHMKKTGALLDSCSRDSSPCFVVGSSGVEKAICDHLKAQGLINPATFSTSLHSVNQILVVSGSMSPVTAVQIKRAVAGGFEEFALDPEMIFNPDEYKIGNLLQDVLEVWNSGRSVIIHSCTGPDDPRVEAMKRQAISLNDNGIRAGELISRMTGHLLGTLSHRLINHANVKRFVVAGGDTSGFVVSQLGIQAMEMIAPVVTGAPLCRAYAEEKPVDGLEINLKGGQVGDENYFTNILNI